MCVLVDVNDAKIGPTCRPIVYANGADLQSGMWCLRQISKFKRLVWLKVMLPIIFFLADKVF